MFWIWIIWFCVDLWDLHQYCEAVNSLVCSNLYIRSKISNFSISRGSSKKSFNKNTEIEDKILKWLLNCLEVDYQNSSQSKIYSHWDNSLGNLVMFEYLLAWNTSTG